MDVYDNTGKIAGTDAPITVLAGQPHSAVPNIDISRGLTAERAAKAGGLVENDRGISPGANVSNEQLRVLPLYNRNFLALGLLQPGCTMSSRVLLSRVLDSASPVRPAAPPTSCWTA